MLASAPVARCDRSQARRNAAASPAWKTSLPSFNASPRRCHPRPPSLLGRPDFRDPLRIQVTRRGQGVGVTRRAGTERARERSGGAAQRLDSRAWPWHPCSTKRVARSAANVRSECDRDLAAEEPQIGIKLTSFPMRCAQLQFSTPSCTASERPQREMAPFQNALFVRRCSDMLSLIRRLSPARVTRRVT